MLATVFTDGLGSLIFFGLLIGVIAAGVWFFTGPAKQAEAYMFSRKAMITSVDDQVLFEQMYRAKGPKSVVVAWLLSAFLSPTVSYLYRAKWFLAILSFITLQGFFVWWFLSLFTTPFEVMRGNQKLADQAFIDLKLARPNALRSEPSTGSYLPA